MFNELQNTLKFMSGKDISVSHLSAVDPLAILLTNVVIIMAFGISFVALAFSLIQFITSTGDKKAVEQAQRSMLWAGLGLFASLAAFPIKDLIFRLLEINL